MSEKMTLFVNPKFRVFLLTFGVLITAVVVTASSAVYLPVSLADKIGLPVLLFPFIWLGLFFYVCFCQSIGRVMSVLGVLTLAHLVAVYFSLQAG